MRRARRGWLHAPEVKGGRIWLRYLGLDDVLRTTSICFDPVPDRISGRSAAYALSLAPQTKFVAFIEVACEDQVDPAPPRRTFLASMREARRELHRSASRAASVATSHDILNEGLRRSVADLYMLMTDKEEGPYPYAGIPWFST